MKKAFSFLVIAVLCLAIILPASADTLHLYRIDYDGVETFQALHPELQCTWSEQDYHNDYELSSALLTGEFDSDVYNLDSIFFDCKQFMKKGYCVDLSESEIIREEIAKMHPSIAAQVMQDDKIYAIPFFLSFDFRIVDAEGWTAAGFSEADVPTSFPEFLDFLSAWVDRIENNPEPNISINNRWDETLYNEYSYTGWLTNMLMENYIMQLQFAGQPLRFNNDELISLLNRVQEVGAAIYRSEPITKGRMQLFSEVASNRWPDTMDDGIVFLRINDTQPQLIKSYMSMYAIYPGTAHEDLAMALMEHLVTNIPESDSALIYCDAEPVPNPNYESELARVTENIARTEEALQNSDLGLDEIETLELALQSYQKVLEGVESRKYLMSSEQLQNYQSYVDALYFPVPGIFFRGTDEGWTMAQMQDQFAAGLLSAQEFVQKMDHLAEMVEMENAD